MAETRELAFLDLVVIERIDKDSVVERFGSKINFSFFDAANLLGTLKIKGYVDIESAVGFSPIKVTEKGTELMKLAQERVSEPIDEVDTGILNVMATGVSDVETLARELNIRDSDLAFHLYKLVKLGLIDYNLRAGKVSVMLTELGFKRAGGKKARIVTNVDMPARKEEENVPQELMKETGIPKTPNQGATSDKWVRLRSKTRYYLKTWIIYAIVLIIIAIIVIAGLVYFVFKR